MQQSAAVDARLAYLRLGLVFLFVLVGAASLSRGTFSAWLFPPAAAFVVVAVIHDRVIRKKQLAEKAVVFYECSKFQARACNDWNLELGT